MSGADVAGVEGARDGGVFRAFEDGAAVGKDGHLVGLDAEGEQKVVVAHIGDSRSETLAENGEVERTAALVNLHGIAAAHSDVRLRFAG